MSTSITPSQTMKPQQAAVRPEDGTSRREGPVAKAIEEKTSRLPSDLFLWAAGGAMAASLTLQAMHQKERSTFVGQWVPTFLILGLYNKMVKQHGSDGD